jgi:heme/copper-type cytochrome/quinol oxidase subunit 3
MINTATKIMDVIRKIKLRGNISQFVQTAFIVIILSTSILFLGGSHIYAQLIIRTLILILSGITAWNIYHKKNDLHDLKNNVLLATLFFGLYLGYLVIQQSNWSQQINSYDPYITYRNIIQLLYYYLFFLCCL